MTMTMRELISKIDKSEINEHWANIEGLCYELDLTYDYFEEDEALKCYWLSVWLDTDTYVGERIYYLNDEPICYSNQRGRKNDERFYWFSKECAKKTRDYIQGLLNRGNTILEEIELCDLEGEVSESSYYEIDYNNCVINWNNIYHQGEKVEFIEKVVEDKMDTIIGDKIVIKTPSGELKTVSLRGDILFKLHIND